MKRRASSLVLWLALTIGFALGLLQLVRLRFETGDVYPPYSSLRADPLGTSVLYESLQRLPGMAVSRDFRPTDQLPEGRNLTYLHVGGDREEWQELPEKSVKAIETFVKMGGRLVIALLPEPTKHSTSPFRRDQSEVEKKAKPSRESPDQPTTKTRPGTPPGKKEKSPGVSGPELHLVALAERWGIGFAVKDMKRGADDSYEPLQVSNLHEPELTNSLAWHSGVILTKVDPAWRVIFAREGDPVLVERKWGRGTMVFATDAYFLSNEALQKARHAELLAWVVGPCGEVMFDEAHLGIVDNPGVAMLLRKYRLQGLMAGLLLLAGLFLWKNAAGFGPAREPEAARVFVAGKDSAAGFVNLLRRHLGTRDILPTCVAEWQKSLPPGARSAERRERVEAFLRTSGTFPPAERQPVRLYQTICVLIKQPAGCPAPNLESPLSPLKQ